MTRDGVISGTVESCQGRITNVSPGTSALPDALDLAGDYLIPGLIDLHTDALEKHHSPRLGVRWPIASAIASHDAQMATSGVTTVFDSLSIGVGGEDESLFRDRVDSALQELRNQHEHHLRAEHFLHLRLELPHPETAQIFSQYEREPLLKLVSIMDHTPGQGQYADIERWRGGLRRGFQRTSAEVDAELERRLDGHRRYAGPNRKAIGERIRETGLPLASHDDRTLDDIERAMEAGVSIAEFPVTLDAAEAAHGRGLAILMGGPNLVLGGSHSGNAAASDVAMRGWLHGLTSDYVPSSLLQGAFILAERHGFRLEDAIGTVCWAPARLVNLTDRGAIEPGLRADFVRIRRAAGIPRVISVWREGNRVA